MLCLGIESSCDETALALVRDGLLVDAVLSSQADIHALFGGVVPELASREHYRLIGALYDSLMQRQALSVHDLDYIAVARGPGLLGSLLVGVAFAKGLVLGSQARLIGVNHLQAHLLAAGLEQEIHFPALGLLVSGGHTHLYYIENATNFTQLGRTLDDAAGEAYDKVAKMLHLPYPGGHLLDRLAQKGTVSPKLFPRPYTDNETLDFSFSGLKTAFSNWLAHENHIDFFIAPEALDTAPQKLCDVCASFSHAVADTLALKTRLALHQQTGQVRSLVVAGGVAANNQVRAAMATVAEEAQLPLVLPSRALCTDNGAMIAYAGYLLGQAGKYHTLDLEAIPRGQHIPDDYRVLTMPEMIDEAPSQT